MQPAPPFGHRAAWAIRYFAAYGVSDQSATLIVSRYSSSHLQQSSLLKIGAAVAFVRGCVLDRRDDVFRRPTLRALELRDRIGQVYLADAAVELVRFDTVFAFAAIAPLTSEYALDVVVEATRRQVVAARRLVIDHGRPLPVRTP